MTTVFIVSAPSGSGKSTLVRRLLANVPGLMFSVSYTTRPPRGHEVEGENYHFISRAEFRKRVALGEFLEHAEVFGNYYGTARGALEHARKGGKDLLLDIDVQGAVQVIHRVPEAVSIFVVPPSPEVLERRLRNRSQAEGVTDEAVIQRRLAQAKQELLTLDKYKYVLINDALEEAVTELRAIVRFERGEGGEEAATVAQQLRTTVLSPRLKAVLKSFGISDADL